MTDDNAELAHIADEIKALEVADPALTPEAAPEADPVPVQRALIAAGYSPANGRPAWEPGTWDAQSEMQVREFQLAHHLSPTGRADPDTCRALGL